MGVVGLEIQEPLHGANFVGTRQVRLRGRVLTSGHPALFFKWYSNLVTPPAPTKDNPDTSLNRANTAALDFTPTLHVGSQVITLTARDVASEDPKQLVNVRHAGMAGGPPVLPPPPGVPPPCVIHVLFAEVLKPAAGATLSKANSTLEAKAPPLWDDAEYQAKVNRLRFRWMFEPTGLPAGRASAELVPAPAGFDKEKFILRHQGALPAQLVAGTAYALRLRVERTDAAGIFHDSAPLGVSISA
ncbi:MAG TPA: hypothetical protein VN282_11820 [Pyrinomonadaceae bacterium]|nr:hypothetical protein [Pyrinomonadaceae bacterium]